MFHSHGPLFYNLNSNNNNNNNNNNNISKNNFIRVTFLKDLAVLLIMGTEYNYYNIIM